MGKKKKKVKVVYRDVYRDAPQPKKPVVTDVTAHVTEEPAIDISPERQKQAVDRLTAMLKALSEKPKPILDMLFELEIPWERKALEDGGEDYIVIKAADLEAGNERHLAKGSLAERIWGDMAKENLAKNPVPQRVMPDNDVEVIQPQRMPGASDFANLFKKLQEAQEQAAGQNGMN